MIDEKYKVNVWGGACEVLVTIPLFCLPIVDLDLAFRHRLPTELPFYLHYLDHIRDTPFRFLAG